MVNWLSSTVALIRPVPVDYFCFTHLPAQENSAAINFAREIQQADIQIFDLNAQIKNNTATDQQSSALLDQRDVALGNLAKVIGIKTSNNPDGSINLANPPKDLSGTNPSNSGDHEYRFLINRHGKGINVCMVILVYLSVCRINVLHQLRHSSVIR